MYLDKVKGAHDNRFDNLNLLPNISTKFIRNDRSCDLGKFASRNDKAIINQEYSGGQFYNKNMTAVKRNPVALVGFDKITARRPLIEKPIGDQAPLGYSDRAHLGVDNKLALKRNSHMG
jgi:hypothetical protein